jgi:hypothetical protein
MNWLCIMQFSLASCQVHIFSSAFDIKDLTFLREAIFCTLRKQRAYILVYTLLHDSFIGWFLSGSRPTKVESGNHFQDWKLYSAFFRHSQASFAKPCVGSRKVFIMLRHFLCCCIFTSGNSVVPGKDILNLKRSPNDYTWTSWRK